MAAFPVKQLHSKRNYYLILSFGAAETAGSAADAVRAQQEHYCASPVFQVTVIIW